MERALIARVRNGRLVLDEPTDLPEGEEVELVPVGVDDMEAELSAEESQQLDESIVVSFEQAKNGQLIDADVVLEIRPSGPYTTRAHGSWTGQCRGDGVRAP